MGTHRPALGLTSSILHNPTGAGQFVGRRPIDVDGPATSRVGGLRIEPPAGMGIHPFVLCIGGGDDKKAKVVARVGVAGGTSQDYVDRLNNPTAKRREDAFQMAGGPYDNKIPSQQEIV